jgi:hypothetical protein
MLGVPSEKVRGEEARSEGIKIMARMHTAERARKVLHN